MPEKWGNKTKGLFYMPEIWCQYVSLECVLIMKSKSFQWVLLFQKRESSR